MLYFKSSTNSIELNRMAKTTKKSLSPLHLFDAVSFSFHLFLSETYEKKASYIASSSISVFVIQIQRENFFLSHGKKTQKRGAPPKKAARSMHETDPSCLQSPPYLQFSGVFFLLFFCSIYYAFRLLVHSVCLPIVKKGFPQTNSRFAFRLSQLILNYDQQEKLRF